MFGIHYGADPWSAMGVKIGPSAKVRPGGLGLISVIRSLTPKSRTPWALLVGWGFRDRNCYGAGQAAVSASSEWPNDSTKAGPDASQNAVSGAIEPAEVRD